MNDHGIERMKGLAAAYALGVLDPAEREQFETALANSPELQKDVADYRETSALLALSSPEVSSSADGWGRVRAKISAQRDVELSPPHSRARRHSTIAWISAAAAIVVAAGLGIRATSIQRQVEQLTDELVETNGRVIDRQNLINDILGVRTEQFVLTSDAAENPGMRVFWNRESNTMVLNAYALNPVNQGQVYQMWFIHRDGQVQPSDTFNTSPAGDAVVRVTGPANPDGLVQAAVSIEPAGGSLQPTGDIVLAGGVGIQ